MSWTVIFSTREKIRGVKKEVGCRMNSDVLLTKTCKPEEDGRESVGYYTEQTFAVMKENITGLYNKMFVND